MLSRHEISVTRQPSQTELAYLAGIIDGEGHVEVTKGRGGLVLCMADTQILDWVHEHFGGTYSSGWVNEKNASRRPRRMWQLRRAADLAHLLPLLDPYLVLKREECAALRQVAELTLSPDGHQQHGRTPEWHARREELVAEARAAFNARRS